MNILWLLLGGFISCLLWGFVGLIFCATIIGIPIGLQCFKMAVLCFAPFGKEVVYTGQTFSLLVNILWICSFGWMLALFHLVLALMLFVTILGIPFGFQFLKLAKLSLAPFGAEIVRVS